MSFSRSNPTLETAGNEKGIDGIKMIIDTGFIQLRYTDVLGKFHAKYVFENKETFDSFFKSGVGVDGSSVGGFAAIDDSDLLLVPDKSTLRIFPPSLLNSASSPISSNYKLFTVIADVYQGFNKGRLVRDPRYVSHRMEELLLENNLSCQIGPEVECFVFDKITFSQKKNMDSVDKDDLTTDNRDHSGSRIMSMEGQGSDGCKYPIRRKDGYDAPPFQDSLLEFRFDVAELLRKNFSINITNLNHEVASFGQIEINFMHSTLTSAADNVQVYKDVVRNVAKKYNKIANFMPKPLFDNNDPLNGGDNGSGMHTSISLWNDSSTTNIFYDSNDAYAELSQMGRYFIGGLIDHAHSLAAIVAPTINSYHRLIPGFEAPVYIAWAKGNRSAVIRIPINERNNSKSKRIEFRAPDPAANPYLAFSAIVAAGYDGIKKSRDPGSPTDENIYKMSDSKRNSLGIRSLPASLGGSLDSLKSDSAYLKSCFHNEILDSFIMRKDDELGRICDKSLDQEILLYYDV
jgi:glutamine synthetase